MQIDNPINPMSLENAFVPNRQKNNALVYPNKNTKNTKIIDINSQLQVLLKIYYIPSMRGRWLEIRLIVQL